METVLFGYFFFRGPAPAPAKFKLRKRKKIKKKRKGLELVQNRNERGKHACLAVKSALQLTLPTF